jgi:hypothetical protein
VYATPSARFAQHVTAHLAISHLLFQPINSHFNSLHHASAVNKGTCEGKITRRSVRLRATHNTLEWLMYVASNRHSELVTPSCSRLQQRRHMVHKRQITAHGFVLPWRRGGSGGTVPCTPTSRKVGTFTPRSFYSRRKIADTKWIEQSGTEASLGALEKRLDACSLSGMKPWFTGRLSRSLLTILSYCYFWMSHPVAHKGTIE